jgi:hypothetical protein
MRWLKNLFSRGESTTPASPGEPGGPGDGGAAEAAAPAAASDWESHQRTSAAGPVAIAVDLALAARAPIADLPRLVRFRYPLRAPRPDGLPEVGEAEALVQVEDLVAAAAARIGGLYAGRVTLGGFREHLFYAPDAAPISEALAAAQAGVAEYVLEAAGEDDPGWHAYAEELCPTPRAWRWLLDRRAVEALARRGDKAAARRPVDHQASFPSAEAREAFVAEAAVQGFEAAERRDDGPPPTPFGVDLRREDPVTLREIHAVAWALAEVAARHGGAYDGWEAPVETRLPEPVA